MPKANIKRPDGTTITIEGSADEIAALMHKIEGKSPGAAKTADTKTGRKKPARLSIPDLLMSRHEDGFFKQPKDLAQVKQALDESGHIYEVARIATALLRLVKRRDLRRIKQEGRWFYVG